MITIQFTPWAPFHARKNQAEIHRWLEAVGQTAEDIFKSGMGGYPPASSPGAWPNRRTSSLHGSVSHKTGSDQVEVGSAMPYSIFLRSGTSKMARRKMSDNALKEAIPKTRLGHWVEWVRG